MDDVRRLAAALQGALEGLNEALHEHDLAEDAKLAARQAGEISRAAVVEGRAQAQTPEMQQAARGISHAAHKTADLAHQAADAVRGTSHNVADGVSTRADGVMTGVHDRVDAVRTGVHDRVDAVKTGVHERVDHVREGYDHAKARVDEAVESAKFAAARLKAETKVRAEAVAETGRRARVAPSRIAGELGDAMGAWWRGFMVAMAMYLVIGVLGIVTLVVLTIGLVVGLNALFGDPLGTFAVVILYSLAMAGAFMYAKNARARSSDEVEEHVERSKEEARHVVRPVRDAFSRGRTGI